MARSIVFIVISFLISGLCLHSTLFGQTSEDPTDSTSFFETILRDTALKVTIKTDHKHFLKNKKKEEYQPATIAYQEKDGKWVERNIEIKSRGNMRLKTCYYPPIRLKLSEEDISKEGWKSHKKYKLVVGCKNGESYNQMVLREYLAYRINQIITEHSFRVQLLELTIIDTEGNREPRTTVAFIIEDEDELADRLNGTIFDPASVSRNALLKEAYAYMSIFQYMIGNTDWFVLNKHNAKFLHKKNVPLIIPIAYDFDFAGLVNAPYAVTNEEMPIQSVTERFFIGECGEFEQLQPIIEDILQKKASILQLPEDLPQLEDRSKEYVLKYLKESFEILEDPDKMQKEIERGCGWEPKALR